MKVEVEVDIDDDLLESAREYSGIADVNDLVTAALESSFVEERCNERQRAFDPARRQSKPN